ncbi:MAG: serine/threonine-protein kinase [Planctomycetota bacterium]|nr:serine/threonine-protein kinase [Planctomycetota bacterium]
MYESTQTLGNGHDQQLANLISELADGFGRGEDYSLEEVCRQHPEFAEDLRLLWATIALTRNAGKQQQDIPTRSGRETQVRESRFELPHDLGDYLLEREIGRGGMGIVYQAVCKADDSPVAIKMILDGDLATPEDRQRFVGEVEAAAGLNHPHIVPVYEMGEQDGRAFYCMKLIQGQTLSQRLASGPMPPRQAARLLLEISLAIEHAHQHGVLHRDLKPSNILIDDSGHAYVADFGLAKKQTGVKSLTRSGAVLGTPSYMAPEQAAGARGQVGAVSDVYSLGAILYHAITGRPPFLGESPVETVLMVLEQDPVLPRELNRQVNRDLEMIVMRCLQKPQDLRYETAGQLASDLQAFLDDRSTSARDGRIGHVIANLFRETHHASVLENWGLIWMWHSLALLLTCVVTQLMFEYDFRVYQYVLVWTLGFGAWVSVFWWLRRRMGPVTFVERQIAHVWAASLCMVVFMFPLEYHLGLEPLQLAPFLAVVAGMTFVIKAGILSGQFYCHAFLLFATAIVMASFPAYAMVIFGFVSAACFYFSGLKYYRRRLLSLDAAPTGPRS